MGNGRWKKLFGPELPAPNSELQRSISESVLRQAAKSGKGDDVGDDGGDEQPRFAGEERQYARAQHQGDHPISQNSHRKFH